MISNWVELPKQTPDKGVYIQLLQRSLCIVKGYDLKSVNFRGCVRSCTVFVCLTLRQDWNGILLLSFSNPSTLRFASNWSKVIKGKMDSWYDCVSLFSSGASIAVCMMRAYIYYWNAHFKSSFLGPAFYYCFKKCRNPISLNQSLL